MQIKNPTNNKIEGVLIKGEVYSIDANGTLDNIPEEIARYWQENLHKFLILKKDKLENIKEIEQDLDLKPKEDKVDNFGAEVTEVSSEEVTPIVKDVKIKKVK